MCGIAGIFAYGEGTPPVNQEELLRIREAMTSRGPDGAGLWLAQDGRAGLAHRRLSIIDLSDAGAQPMMTGDGRLRIVFNGEIYNYCELRSALEKKGYRFHSHSDTEVLLHLYADKGPDMVHELRGMFAFGLWDEKQKGFFLARDPFGIKPLYYADDGTTLRFASQVKALLAGRKIDISPEPAGHVGFFIWGSVPEPYTLYKGIRSLPAGTTMWVGRERRQEPVTYFNIGHEFSSLNHNGLKKDKEEAKAHLRAALLDSVEHHLIADVPVGLFLSSGLDSTTLTGLAAEASLSSLQTVTLAFSEYQGTENDESPLAERVAQQYGTTHQTSWLSAADFQADLTHLLAAMDQPTVDGVNTYFVSKVTVARGLKVALSGLGGDEIFGGYYTFQEIPRLVKMLGLTRYSPGLGKAFRWVSAPWLKHATSPKYAGLLEYGNSYGGAYLLRRSLFMPWELPEILNGEMVREGWKELQPLIRLEETIHGINVNHLKVSALELAWYMRNQLLRDADWAGMAHSLEIRVPLVDAKLVRDIVPFLAKEQLLTKLDMALTPIKPLPEKIIKRHKTGFHVPVQEWLQRDRGDTIPERGLRSWSKFVYHQQVIN